MTNLYGDVLMAIVCKGFRKLWGKRRDTSLECTSKCNPNECIFSCAINVRFIR